MSWHRIGKRNQLVIVTQDAKKLDFIAAVVDGKHGAARGDTIEEAVDAATGVGR